MSCHEELKPSFSVGKTLEEASEYFGLYSRLRDVETSLQDVKNQKKSRDEHESHLKLLNEEILQLRYKFHPDRAKVKFESDIELAQDRLAALNAIRTVLNLLNKTFLDNGDYGFHTNLDEDDIRELIYETFYKISFLSEKKQEYLNWFIKLFLTASKKCLKNFIEKKWFDCMMYRSHAVSYLTNWLLTYAKLQSEFKAAGEEFKSKSLDSAHELMRKMSSDCSRDLLVLRELERVTRERMDGAEYPLYFFNITNMTDGYFVWPFVHYMNVMFMCNAVAPPKADLSEHWDVKEKPSHNLEQSAYIYPYYLASYLCGSKEFEEEIKAKLGKDDLDMDELKNEFLERLKEIGKDLEEKFNTENYIERSSTYQLVDDFVECLRKLDTFEREGEGRK